MSFNIFRIEILNINIYKNLIVLNQLKCFFIIFHIVVDFDLKDEKGEEFSYILPEELLYQVIKFTTNIKEFTDIFLLTNRRITYDE